VKAVLFQTPGSPDVLQVQQVPEPTLQRNTELLVRLKAAGVNPIDTKLRQRGTFYPEQVPTILGCDGAGVVEAIGSEVQDFRVGDRVYFCNGGLGGHPGTYAEYATIDEKFAAPMPQSLSFAEAAAVPLVLITAWEALYDRARLEAGRSVLVHAGAGGVGHIALQLAKLKGANTCTTVSSAEKAAFVHDLGAEKIIFYTQTDVVREILAWTRGEGVDLAFDTVGGKVLSQSFASTCIYGDVVTILAPDANTDWKTARDRNLRVSYELMLTPMLKGLVSAQQEQAKILKQCVRLFDQGELKIHVGQTLPLEAAAIAHRRIESGSTIGKIVLLMES